MSLRRFLVEPSELIKELAELGREETAHARKVLRLRPGDEVWLLDGAGRRARAVVEELGKTRALCRVLAVEAPPPPRPRLVICPGLLKTPAMELLAVKLTELMADEVRPFLSAHTVPRLDDPVRRVERWQRLAAQALKQCGALRAPVFHPPRDLRELLGLAPPGAARLLLYEDERGDTLARALPGLADAGEIWALLGPEGGFASGEAQEARAAGFKVLGLGPAILRAETAALAVAALLRLGLPTAIAPAQPSGGRSNPIL